MSYCVNCGVELADSEKNCPLCYTEVVNPRKPWKEPSSRPYPRRMETIMRHIDRRYVASLLGVFICIPAVVTLLSDLLDGSGITWSAYVIGAVIMVGVCTIVPLYFKRYHFYTFLMLDCAAITLYLLFINTVTDGDWFMPLALPVCATVTVLTLSALFFFRQPQGRLFLVRVAIVLIYIGILTLVIELATDLYSRGEVFLNWSPYVIVSCLALAVATQLIERRKKLKEEIRKRLFY